MMHNGIPEEINPCRFLFEGFVVDLEECWQPYVVILALFLYCSCLSNPSLVLVMIVPELQVR